MSNYHIQAGDLYGNEYRVVMHFPVADVENEVGTPYRTAIVEWQGGAPIESELPNIGTEQAQLDAGELYERGYPFHSNPNETLEEKRDKLDLMFAEKLGDVQDEVEKVLGFWGYERDVP
jgi:hypothetical protein